MGDDEELRREIDFHLKEQTAAYIQAGLPSAEAERQARLRFGGAAQISEDCRAVRGWRLLDELRDDIRFAARLARRTPLLTATTILALALGIGAASTIFTVVNAVLLKPLPYAAPSELVMVWSRAPRDAGRENTISPADFLDFAARARTLRQLEGYFSFISPLEVSLGDATEITYAQTVTPGLFDLLGRRAAWGRTFRRDAYEPEVVLSHGYWQRRFGGDPGVLGRAIRIGAQPATIVGVMPADVVFPYPGMLGPSGFTRTTDVDLWASMAFAGPMGVEQRTVGADGNVPRGVRWLGAIGRRRADASIDQVRGELGAIAGDLASAYPDTNRDWDVVVNTVADQTVGKVRPALLLLFAGVGVVLLMATVNVANLMLSRSLARRTEYATRVALGAGRRRLIRQSAVESLLLAAAGGTLGLAIGLVGVRMFVRMAPADLPRVSDIVPDWYMVGITLAVAASTALFIGLVPAATAATADPQAVLREHGRGATAGRAQRRYRTALVVGQVALACTLTVGATLLLRSFASVMSVDPGFEPRRLLTWQMNIPERLRTPDERRAFYRGFFDRMQQIPGVISVGGTTRLPLGSTSVTTTIEIQGRPEPPSRRIEVEFRRALHRYFETMQIPVLRGRGFDERDAPDAPPVVVVNQTLARRVFPGGDPIGQRLRTGPTGAWMEVVGVIGDVRHAGLEQAPAPELYIHYLQNPPVSPFIVIRTTGDPSALADAVRAEARRIDRDLPLYDIRTMSEVRAAAVAQRRFVLGLVAFFGAVALLLAAVGIDGAVSVSVAERMHEMSIRLALGADPAQLWRMVVGQATRTTVAGLLIGLALAWLSAPLVRAQLFGVAAGDPLTLVVVCLLFLTVAAAAALVPARRAAQADPATALRGT